MTGSELDKARADMDRARDDYLWEFPDEGREVAAYEAEGFAVGEEAADLAEDDREGFIESEALRIAPESLRHVVECAAFYRVAQLNDGASLSEAA